MNFTTIGFLLLIIGAVLFIIGLNKVIDWLVILGILLALAGLLMAFPKAPEEIEQANQCPVRQEAEAKELESQIHTIVQATLELTDEEYEQYCKKYGEDVVAIVDNTPEVQNNVVLANRLREYREKRRELEELKE